MAGLLSSGVSVMLGIVSLSDYKPTNLKLNDAHGRKNALILPLKLLFLSAAYASYSCWRVRGQAALILNSAAGASRDSNHTQQRGPLAYAECACYAIAESDRLPMKEGSSMPRCG